MNLLATGTTPTTIATDFWTSAEHRGLQVDSYYETFLNRPADPAGRQAWVNDFILGWSESSVMAGFMSSTEFRQAHPTATEFTTALYQDILGRAPDQAGLAMWVAFEHSDPGTDAAPLSAQTQAALLINAENQVIPSFLNSAEHDTNLVNAYFNNYLQRPADPTGLTNWVQQLEQGLVTQESLAIDFLSSPEFISDNPLT